MNRQLLQNAAAGEAFDTAETVRALTIHSLYLEKLLRRVHPGLFKENEIQMREIEELIGSRSAQLLLDAGYWNLKTLANIPADDLLAIDGIGKATVDKLLRIFGRSK